jgi:sulfur carrier protein ThiS
VKIHVRLLGTLGKHCQDHDPRTGMELDVPKDAQVQDIVEILGLPADRIGFVSVDGELVEGEDTVREGATVKFFHPIRGG